MIPAHGPGPLPRRGRRERARRGARRGDRRRGRHRGRRRGGARRRAPAPAPARAPLACAQRGRRGGRDAVRRVPRRGRPLPARPARAPARRARATAASSASGGSASPPRTGRPTTEWNTLLDARFARIAPEGASFESILAVPAPIYTSATMVRRDAFLEAGGFDPAFDANEDLDLYLRLSRRAPLRPCPGEPVSVYRLHGANTPSDALYEAAVRLADKHLPQATGRGARAPARAPRRRALGPRPLRGGAAHRAPRRLRVAVARSPTRASPAGSPRSRCRPARWRRAGEGRAPHRDPGAVPDPALQLARGDRRRRPRGALPRRARPAPPVPRVLDRVPVRAARAAAARACSRAAAGSC